MRISKLLAIALMAQSAAAADFSLLFTDTFESSETYDINLEAASGRQSGVIAPLNYVESAPSDDQTQVNAADAPGKLRLEARNNAPTVSPDHNFIEGGTFSIEFDIDPGLNDVGGTSDDWTAVVFGATKSKQFVNGSDGFGILFRNNGNIQVFDSGAAVYGGNGGVDGGLPQEEFHVRIDVVTANFLFGSPATLTVSVNGQAIDVATDAGGAGLKSYTKQGGLGGNYLSFLSYASAGKDWVSTFDNIAVSAIPCVSAFPGRVDRFFTDTTPETITVTIPPGANATSAVDVTVASRDAAVATPSGAVGGSTVLHFGPGEANTQTVDLVAVGAGRTTFDLTASGGLCIQNGVQFTVRKGFVANPSFENNPPTAFPTYGPIDGWIGGTGVNRDNGGPFADNGKIPDRHQVAHLQGSRSIKQTLSGLDPAKRYLLQYRYNARNCCGAPAISLTPRFAGVDLETVNGITPVSAAGGTEYYYGSVAFFPASDIGDLEFATSITGDGTVVLDAISIVQRDEGNVLVQNPSFEASGEPASPGTIAPASISGWVGSGTYGVNFTGGGVFADNGDAPDQDLVAFLQGQGSSLSQKLNGLVAGKTYSVSYAYNARLANAPHLKVTAGDAVIQDEDITPVGGSAAYRTKSATFVASGPSLVLKFEQTAAGDNTALIDDVRVVGESVNIPCIRVGPASLQIGAGQEDALVTVSISSQLNANQDASVTITTLDPTIAEPVGAVNGSVELVFPAGGETVGTVAIRGLKRGVARLDLSNSFNLCFDNPRVTVAVIGSFIRNPSFESNFNPAFPGYSPIDSWGRSGGGNTGVNEANGPFHDNGNIADRARVAVLQGNISILQTLFGLTPGKQYWLQARYNTRNCCGAHTEQFSAQLDGNDLAQAVDVTAVGAGNPYSFISIPFYASAASGELALTSTVGGDATLLLDAVSVVQRDENEIVVENPSFEASGLVAFPGYLQPAPMAGWVGAGSYGVNAVGTGPFADNGVNPDQDSVAFLQGKDSSLTQTLTGLTPGEFYELSYSYNARAGNAPTLRVTAAGTVIQDEAVTPVGGNNAYPVRSGVFQAGTDPVAITFAQTAAGDNTVMIDDIHIRPGSAPGPRLTASLNPDSKLVIAWPGTATAYKLQSSDKLAGSPWTDVTDLVLVNGNEFNIVVNPTAAQRYYRLVPAL